MNKEVRDILTGLCSLTDRENRYILNMATFEMTIKHKGDFMFYCMCPPLEHTVRL